MATSAPHTTDARSPAVPVTPAAPAAPAQPPRPDPRLRPQVNPYRYAFDLVKNRLRWDLRPEARRSRRHLAALRDRHWGEAAVVICNGPSLNKVDLSLLDGLHTLGMNKINLLFDRSSFRPSCILAVDKMIISQNLEFYNSTDIPLFIDYRFLGIVRPRPGVTFLHSTDIPRLAHDCTLSINYGRTVTVVALQMALHLGFSDVAIIGCDHYFALQGKPSSTHVSTGQDHNHFDPRYFTAGQKTDLPNYAVMEHYYQMVREAFEQEGRSIMNCTAGGRLEVFERMDLAGWVAEQKRKRGRAPTSESAQRERIDLDRWVAVRDRA